MNTKVLDGISFVLATPGGGTYADTRYWDKSIDGRKAYCVQPGIMDLANDYDGAPITDERYVRASLADYWGRVRQGDGPVPQFYVQLYLWEQLGCSLQSLSDPSGAGRVSHENYNAWKAGIQPAIDAYFTSPSFAGQTVTIVVGTTEKLTDANKVLPYFELLNNPTDAKVEMSGNTLKLSAAASAKTEGIIAFNYSIDATFQTPAMYWNAGSPSEQDCMTVGVGPVVNFFELK